MSIEVRKISIFRFYVISLFRPHYRDFKISFSIPCSFLSLGNQVYANPSAPEKTFIRDMFSRILVNITVAIWLAYAQALSPTPPGLCQNLRLSITTTAETIVVPPLPNLSQPGAVLKFFGSIPDIVANAPRNQTKGTYDIAATYCPPKGGVTPKKNGVQLLVHGASYTKEYWMGGAWHGSNLYSWTKFANKAGFGTLAVDRLGNGASEHPDPAQVVQLTLEMEILNVIAQKIKTGEITGTPSKVFYVGHSMGATVGAMLAAKYPKSIDKLVLTGYTTDESNIPPVIAAGQYLPAKDVDPARFGTLSQGYVTQSVESGRTVLCYAGGFDPTIPPMDYATRATLTVGEALGLSSMQVPNYKGAVFVLTGDKDRPYCGTDPKISCETFIKTTAAQFPQASTFGFFIPPNTGHCLNFHYTAPRSFAAVAKWLLLDAKVPSY
jgi:pimeloyl-ACP methyl ester carboxylesterase